MLIQEKISSEVGEIQLRPKRVRPNNPTFKMRDKIQKTLDEWNTIEGVELYEDLYNLCSQLFLETQDKKLACLNYYIDHERDTETGVEHTVMYAEIKDTWELPLKERYQKHLDLLERVMSNDTTLIYCSNIEVQVDEGQLSLFG